MPDERIILCLNCGQQNRLSVKGRPDLACCGRCGEPLAPPQKRMRAHSWVTLLLVVTAGVTGYLAYSYEPQSRHPPPTRLSDRPSVAGPSSTANPSRAAIEANHRLGELPHPVPRPPGPNPFRVAEGASATPVQSPSSSTSQKEMTAFRAPPVAISTGVVRIRPGRERIAPLEIKTSSGNDYFIRLLDVTDGQEELAMYIEGARTFTIDVPLGSYELRYCAGAIWYGEPYRFGPDTACYRADKQFTFYRQGNSVNGYTIELILQVGGNLRTTRIDPAQF